MSRSSNTVANPEAGVLTMTLLPSAARTATTNSGDLKNHQHRGVHVVIDAAAAAATPSVVFTVQGKCPLSGQYYTILASAAVTGVSTTVLRVFPGATAAANLTANDCVPENWRVLATAADADSLTYSVSACLLP
jgi:hypothetical protein